MIVGLQQHKTFWSMSFTATACMIAPARVVEAVEGDGVSAALSIPRPWFRRWCWDVLHWPSDVFHWPSFSHVWRVFLWSMLFARWNNT